MFWPRGGLDTSIILKWLVEEYGCEVMHLRDSLVERYAAMIYNCFWFAPGGFIKLNALRIRSMMLEAK